MTYEVSYGSSNPDANGKCPSIYQTLNENRTKCLINARVDVGLHYFITGGIMNRQETQDSLAKRAKYYVNTIHFLKNGTSFDAKQRIFNDPIYKKKTHIVCQNRTIVDYFTIAYVINIPGQEVPIHYDTPYFFGAERYNFPPWLLIMMRRSGLFDEYYVPAIQGITYLHDWNKYNYSLNKGGLKFWPKGTAHEEVLVQPVTNTGVIFDGSAVAHGTETFRPYSKPPSLITKDSFSTLKFNGEKWQVTDEEGQVLASYDESELRITLVWRNGCFHTEEDRLRFRQLLQSPLSYETVIDKMINDLIQKGKITERPKNEHEVVDALVHGYMDYPYDNSLQVPYNLCVIANLISPYIGQFFCK